MTGRIWAIIPAAGAGLRLGNAIPKQYARLNGESILALSIKALLNDERIVSIGVGIAPNDSYFKNIADQFDQRIWSYEGGASRRDTVLNGLLALNEQANDDDWVLVHDAARPLLTQRDLAHLINQCEQRNQGGLLVAPMVDTVKQSNDGVLVDKTIARQSLWCALTPQCFHYKTLLTALAQNPSVTDESQAIEALGRPVQLVVAHDTNFKITYQNDLDLAKFILDKRSVG